MKLRLFTIVAAILAGSPAQSAELDSYGGFTDVKGEKTGFFHTEKIDGRWMLVTPEGHGFWGIGMSHPVTGWTQGAVTFTYDGDQEAVEEAISNYLDAAPSQADVDEYKRLKAKLGL